METGWTVCVWEGCNETTECWTWFIDIPPDDREGHLCSWHRGIMRGLSDDSGEPPAQRLR